MSTVSRAWDLNRDVRQVNKTTAGAMGVLSSRRICREKKNLSLFGVSLHEQKMLTYVPHTYRTSTLAPVRGLSTPPVKSNCHTKYQYSLNRQAQNIWPTSRYAPHCYILISDTRSTSTDNETGMACCIHMYMRPVVHDNTATRSYSLRNHIDSYLDSCKPYWHCLSKWLTYKYLPPAPIYREWWPNIGSRMVYHTIYGFFCQEHSRGSSTSHQDYVWPLSAIP